MSVFFPLRRQREKGKIFDDNDNDDDDDDEKYCNCYCCHKNFKTMMNSVVHSIFSV